jgi:hypothetical protein
MLGIGGRGVLLVEISRARDGGGGRRRGGRRGRGWDGMKRGGEERERVRGGGRGGDARLYLWPLLVALTGGWARTAIRGPGPGRRRN